jgi:hypothetical protein
MVADEFIHGTMFTDNIFESVDNFLGTMHGKNIKDLRLTSNEDLGTIVTVDGWVLGYDGICRDWFVAAENVEHGNGDLYVSRMVGPS